MIFDCIGNPRCAYRRADGGLMMYFFSSEKAEVKTSQRVAKNSQGVVVATMTAEVVGLPEPSDGCEYIVSREVYLAAHNSARGASDLLVPVNPVEEDGRTVYGGLAKIL